MKSVVIIAVLMCLLETRAEMLLDDEAEGRFERRLQADGFVLRDHGDLSQLHRSRLAVAGAGMTEKVNFRHDASGQLYAVHTCITSSVETTKNLEAAKKEMAEHLIATFFPSEPTTSKVRDFISRNCNSTTPKVLEFEGIRVKVYARSCSVWWRWRIQMTVPRIAANG